MSTAVVGALNLVGMTPLDVGAVLVIENAAYEFPWTHGNFIDSLASGHPAKVLRDARQAMRGYFVAMHGVDEMHLLNLTVAPPMQGLGHGRFLLHELTRLALASEARQLWLEVRSSNRRAQAIYTSFGFRASGLRKGYYPAAHGLREDAVVMSLDVAPEGRDLRNALE